MPHPIPYRLTALAASGLLLLTACGDDTATSAGDATTTTRSSVEPVIDPGDGGQYAPSLDPADFVAGVDNPYFPLVPGSRWVYEGDSDGETERIEVEVLAETRVIEGITATVVRDTVYVSGEMVEDTFDWYAQDRDGNVWYLGEDTHEIKDGKPINSEGAWEYGKDGALPGLAMPAHPEVGHAYRQELYAGEAEDMGEILEIDADKEVAAGPFAHVVVTQDWTPLEPEVTEEKWYAPGVGNIYSTHVTGKVGTIELIEFSAGS
jgi:hypothetical protein